MALHSYSYRHGVIGAGHLRDSVSSASNGLVAALALPDTNSLALDGFLSAEGADVAGVLLDFHLLHLLTQGGTVSVVEHIVSTNHSLTFDDFSFFFFDSKFDFVHADQRDRIPSISDIESNPC